MRSRGDREAELERDLAGERERARQAGRELATLEEEAETLRRAVAGRDAELAGLKARQQEAGTPRRDADAGDAASRLALAEQELAALSARATDREQELARGLAAERSAAAAREAELEGQLETKRKSAALREAQLLSELRPLKALAARESRSRTDADSAQKQAAARAGELLRALDAQRLSAATQADELERARRELDELRQEVARREAAAAIAAAAAAAAPAPVAPAGSHSDLKVIPAPALILDEAIRVVEMNAGAEKLLGVPLRDLLMKDARTVARLEPFRPALAAVAASGQPTPEAEADLAIGRRVRRVRFGVVPLPPEARPAAYVLHVSDVTQTRALETYVRHTDRLASLGILAGEMAGDAGQSLKVAARHAEKLVGELSRTPELRSIAEKALASLAQAGRSLASLASAAHSAPAADVPVDVHQALDRVCELLEFRLKASAHVVQRDMAASSPLVASSAEELEAMLANLILYACQDSPTGGIVHVSSSDLPAGVQLRVRVSGRRLPELELSGLLDPLARPDPTKSRAMGPAISRHIVERVGGALQVDPGDEGGMVFTLRLPRAASRPGTRTSPGA
jgi:signal transduction histidine kinase